MARVPNTPYRVLVTKRNGDKLNVETYNEENLVGAMTRRDGELRKERVTRVEVCMVLDESTPNHALDESTRYLRNGGTPRPAAPGGTLHR